MREYELTVLLHPDLEMDLDAPLEKVRKVVTSNGGEIVKEDNWGKRKLAYPIKKENFAVYICFAVKLPSEAVAKISNTLNITDEVLRYLLVMVDEKTKAKLQEAESNKDEESNKE